MQSDPDEGHHDGDGNHVEPERVRSDVRESGEVQQHSKEQENQSDNKAPATSQGSALRRFGRWCRRKWWDSWQFDKEPSIFDAITSAVSIVGVVFLIAQWRQTESALDMARKAQSDAAGDAEVQRQRFERQMETSRAAVDKAQSANSQALDFFKNDQRAWLSISGYEIMSRPTQGNVAWERREPRINDWFMMRFHLRNSGKTPALKVATSIQPQLSRQSPRETIWSKWPKTRIDSTVFPDDSSQYVDSAPFLMASDQLLQEYKAGTLTYFIWVRIYYCDVNRRLHWSQMCAAHPFGPDRATELTRVTFCGPQTVDDGRGQENHPECG